MKNHLSPSSSPALTPPTAPRGSALLYGATLAVALLAVSLTGKREAMEPSEAA